MKILVTGSGGFLGQAVCRALTARGEEVSGLSRNRYPALHALGVTQIEADVASLDSMLAATRGCDAVMHLAAKAGAWGRLEDYYASNVTGTDNAIAACLMNEVPRLVYTSTPSVVHTGADLEGVDERTPYAAHFAAHYPATKRIAEERVLRANAPGLATVALRPHLVWGPGDNHLLPRLARRARAGRLRFIGTESKRIDVTYIDNAVDAHLAALDSLAPGAPCAGRAYFISQGQPIALDEIVNSLLRAVGIAPESRRIPLKLARLLGAAFESVYGALRVESEPPLTRFIVEQMSTAHWYDIRAARRDLGYAPRVSIGDGLGRLAEWYLRTRPEL